MGVSCSSRKQQHHSESNTRIQLASVLPNNSNSNYSKQCQSCKNVEVHETEQNVFQHVESSIEDDK